MNISTFIRASRWAGIATVLSFLMACSAMNAQNPGGSNSPVNAISMEGSDRVLLFGADLVSYFTEGKYVQGNAQFKSTYNNVDYWFSSAQNKALFDQTPAKYQPQYGGYCANGIAFGIPWGGNAQDFAMIDGKLYIFGGEQSKAAFMLKPTEYIALSDQYWNTEIKGNNSFIQRLKRLTFKVPHYKSGEEQAKEIEAAKASAAAK